MSNGASQELATEAMRAHRAGRFDDAEQLCRQVLEFNPDAFSSLVHLSVLLRHRGEFGQSMLLAQRAIQLQPQNVDGYTQLALCLLGAGRQEEAVAQFLRAIELSPRLAPLYHNLGMALENLGNKPEAKQAFIDACRLAPNDVRARLSLGSLLLTEDDIQGAKTQAETSIRLDPQSGAAHLLLAKIQVAQNCGGDAEASIRTALKRDPDSSFGHTMLGFRLLQTGDFEGAEASFHRSIDLDPAQGLAFFGITQARKLSESDRAFISRMQDVLSNVPLTLEQASYLHYGLAKAHDNLDDYGTAMHHFDEAHRKAHLFRFGRTSFDPAPYAADMAATKTRYSRRLLDTCPTGLEAELPIFIVGMMRSGTTLMEQILSCHPEVGAAGEHEFWAKRAHEAESSQKQAFNHSHAVSLARQYCRDLRRVCPGTRHVTDKLPGNYLRLGMIHLALPNAKIIHCRRDPLDTALSIYFTPNPTAPAYSHSKQGIVFAYQQYLALMDHWRGLLPTDRFYEVQYEDLVANPEAVIRDIIGFLGLAWDDACLHHDKNAKEVRTPSLWQVRQPIYSSSVQRWRKYEPFLGDLRQLSERDAATLK